MLASFFRAFVFWRTLDGHPRLLLGVEKAAQQALQPAGEVLELGRDLGGAPLLPLVEGRVEPVDRLVGLLPRQRARQQDEDEDAQLPDVVAGGHVVALVVDGLGHFGRTVGQQLVPPPHQRARLARAPEVGQLHQRVVAREHQDVVHLRRHAPSPSPHHHHLPLPFSTPSPRRFPPEWVVTHQSGGNPGGRDPLVRGS